MFQTQIDIMKRVGFNADVNNMTIHVQWAALNFKTNLFKGHKSSVHFVVGNITLD